MSIGQILTTVRGLFAKVDPRDVGFLIGLGMLLSGGFAISRPWTLVAVGSFLVLASVLLPRRA